MDKQKHIGKRVTSGIRCCHRRHDFCHGHQGYYDGDEHGNE